MDTNQVVFDELILDKSITGTIDLKNNESMVFPNPSNGEFYIKVPPGELFSYCIFNSIGMVISELKNSRASDDPLVIELKNQPRGIYFMELSTEKEKFIETIILY